MDCKRIIFTSLSILLLLPMICNCDFNLVTACEINESERIRIGDTDIHADNCSNDFRKRYACYDPSYGCFISKQQVPGFTVKTGSLGGFDISSTASSDPLAKDPRICAKYCLELPNCMSFVLSKNIHSGRYCFLKNKLITQSTTHTNYLSYNRYAFPDSTCTIGSCTTEPNTPSVSTNPSYNTCKAACNTDSSCKYFTVGMDKCHSQSDCHRNPNVLNKLLCTKSVPALHPPSSTCEKNIANALSDLNNSTCIESKSLPFMSRYPFPGVNKPLSPILLSVYGKNLSCSNGEFNNLLVYIPIEEQFEIKFEGKFKVCKLLFSNLETCQYSCNCNGRHCEGVYIVAFLQNSQLCEISFA
ncbi:unnamed protein product [Dimorphilus gyrociliatus]|uniref:Uncharacterized protein n=1 Tax=Dimorphilus gyrociliatus TaxID=2664684 RepID=A0A7I8WF15_9ANNE|nr:unnamed protein product [Dimorphilus gyrociliatus]